MRIETRMRRALLSALIAIAVSAPARLPAAQGVPRSAGSAASAAAARAHDEAAPLPEMGITQVPARGQTQVPPTPVTPRPHPGGPGSSLL
jgi:hypothetical protein